MLMLHSLVSEICFRKKKLLSTENCRYGVGNLTTVLRDKKAYVHCFRPLVR